MVFYPSKRPGLFLCFPYAPPAKSFHPNTLNHWDLEQAGLKNLQQLPPSRTESGLIYPLPTPWSFKSINAYSTWSPRLKFCFGSYICCFVSSCSRNSPKVVEPFRLQLHNSGSLSLCFICLMGHLYCTWNLALSIVCLFEVCVPISLRAPVIQAALQVMWAQHLLLKKPGCKKCGQIPRWICISISNLKNRNDIHCSANNGNENQLLHMQRINALFLAMFMLKISTSLFLKGMEKLNKYMLQLSTIDFFKFYFHFQEKFNPICPDM